MTKKDYVAIGLALRHPKGVNASDYPSMAACEKGGLTPHGHGYLTAMRDIISAVADVFAADNPSFDRARFLRFVETGKDENTEKFHSRMNAEHLASHSKIDK